METLKALTVVNNLSISLNVLHFPHSYLISPVSLLLFPSDDT